MANASHHKTYDTDSLMRKLYESLVRDFRAAAGPDYKLNSVLTLRKSVTEFRKLSWPERSQAPPWLFKQEAQLENLFKRYRFKTDLYTDQELQDRTMEKFKNLQVRLAAHDWRPVTPESTFRVVQCARSIVRRILNDFDPEQFVDNCRFSTNATVGNGARDAYLDHKLSDPLSGSCDHISWFKNQLPSQYLLAETLRQCSPSGDPTYRVCTSLPLVGVPKSFKSLRLISPNTLIGSFRTYGLGKILVKALKQEGLDVAKLQHRHRYLAKMASINRAYVTADLSSASESFIWTTMAKLLPRKWLRALDFGRLRRYSLAGHEYYYPSFMAMGIGFTFPLQTLLFYALCESVRTLSGTTGFVSVYGDDLIYPRRIHSKVESVLIDLGFELNREKTFVSSHFRESCGGDYFHGVDVRPFSPEGESQQLRSKAYEAWLYQLINGLAERWDEDVIPMTRRLLLLEVLRVAPLAKQVPMSYPSYAGIKTPDPVTHHLSGMIPVSPIFSNGSRSFNFRCLVQTARNRYVSFQEAYYYDALRTLTVMNEQKASDWSMYDTNRDTLHWLQHPKQPKNMRGKDGKRLRRLIAASPCKLTSLQIQTNSGSISDWT